MDVVAMFLDAGSTLFVPMVAGVIAFVGFSRLAAFHHAGRIVSFAFGLPLLLLACLSVVPFLASSRDVAMRSYDTTHFGGPVLMLVSAFALLRLSSVVRTRAGG